MRGIKIAEHNKRDYQQEERNDSGKTFVFFHPKIKFFSSLNSTLLIKIVLICNESLCSNHTDIQHSTEKDFFLNSPKYGLILLAAGL